MRLSHLSEALFCHLYLSQRPSASGACRRILVVTYDAIGDMVMSTPVLEALRKAFPGHALDVLCSPRNAVIIRHCDFVSEVFELNLNSGKSWREWRCLSALRRRGYERVINLFDEAGALALAKIASLASTVYSLPVAHKNRQQQKVLAIVSKYFRFSNKRETRYFTSRLFCILEAFDIPIPESYRYKICVPQGMEKKIVQRLRLSEDGYVLFNPTGTRKANTISKVMICDILSRLLQEYACVIVFDFGLMSSILDRNRSMLENPRLKVITAKDILDVAITVKHASKVLTTDTSIMHIATAYERPVTIIEFRTDWVKTFDPPYGDFSIVPAKSCDYLSGFDVDEVMEKLKSGTQRCKSAQTDG